MKTLASIFCRRVWPAALLVVCGGCAETNADLDASVQGTVTIDGELAPRGAVVFHPEKGGPQAYSAIFNDGTYALRMGQGRIGDPDGGKLRSGKYIATVVVTAPHVKDDAASAGAPPMPGPRITAAKYASEETSGLEFTVKPGVNVIPIEVPRASEEELAAAAAQEKEAQAADADVGSDESKAGDAKEESAPAPESDRAADAAEPATGTAPSEVESSTKQDADAGAQAGEEVRP